MFSKALKGVHKCGGASLLRKTNPIASQCRFNSSLTKNIDYGSDSYDHGFTDYRKSQLEGDTTGRTSHYLLVGGARVMYASLARLTVCKLVATMSASADVLALGSMEFDLAKVDMGKSATFKFRGKPVFVRHRTDLEIELVKADDKIAGGFRDPQVDAERTKAEGNRYIILYGVCTHLGCVPLGGAGDYKASGGWFCPCHGSHYDGSGRIRKGPAPLNLEVPEYKFVGETTIMLG